MIGALRNLFQQFLGESTLNLPDRLLRRVFASARTSSVAAMSCSGKQRCDLPDDDSTQVTTQEGRWRAGVNRQSQPSAQDHTLSTGPSKEDVDVEVSSLLDGDHPITKLKLRARSGLFDERRALKWALRGSQFHPALAKRHREPGDATCIIINPQLMLCFEERHQQMDCEVHTVRRMPVGTHYLNTRWV